MKNFTLIIAAFLFSSTAIFSQISLHQGMVNPLIRENDKSHPKSLTEFVQSITRQVIANGLPLGTLLNVNFPKTDQIKGIKTCRQANAKWAEEFDERQDPYKRSYYWLTGVFQNNDHGQDTDVWALENGYASVVPVQFDLTAHHAIPLLNTWSFDKQ